MNDKPAGWYYVGDGKLRHRDNHGWTDFYMETADPRTLDWPPPDPKTLLGVVREEGSREAARRKGFGRSRRAKRQQAIE
ncbi:hypothetical protein LQK93_02316 [Terrabacter sp. BE26]